MKIARNYLYDSYRKRETERKYLQNHEAAAVRNELEDLSDMVQLRESLSKMKKTYRQVIILRYIQMLSTRETGTILGWSESKVRSTVHRAMKQLREILGPEQEEVNEHEVGAVNSRITDISKQTTNDVRK